MNIPEIPAMTSSIPTINAGSDLSDQTGIIRLPRPTAISPTDSKILTTNNEPDSCHASNIARGNKTKKLRSPHDDKYFSVAEIRKMHPEKFTLLLDYVRDVVIAADEQDEERVMHDIEYIRASIQRK